MTTLVVGASGATGRRLVEQLLDRGGRVKAVVRAPERLPEALRERDRLSVIAASILELGDDEMIRLVDGCGAVASCLGHTPSWKGVYGHPRRLVSDATRRLCGAIRETRPARPTRFVLMNTAGNRDRDRDEPVSLGERCAVGLIRRLLPPHADNEEAAEYLRCRPGGDDTMEWVVVRPDSLTSADQVTEYDVHPSPTRSAIFDPGSVSRVNVGHFMAELITNDGTWARWKGRMPVIYDRPAVG